MSTNHKIKKWTPEWVTRVRNITQIKENDANDQALVEITSAHAEITKKEAQIKELEKDKSSVSTLYLALERLKEHKEKIKTEGLTTYKSAWADFIGTGTNKYRTEGWIKLVKDYHEKKTTINNTPQEYDNLYRGTFTIKEGNTYKHEDLLITEQELIKLTARVVKVMGQIEESKFLATLNSSDTTKYKSLKDREDGKLTSTGNPPQHTNWTTYKTWVSNTLKRIKLFATHGLIEQEKWANEDGKLVPKNSSEGQKVRTEYEFGGDYTKPNDEIYADPSASTTPLKFTATDLTNLLDLVDDIRNSELATSLDDSIKNLDQGAEYAFLPVKKDASGHPVAYTEQELKNWGYLYEGTTYNKNVKFYGSDNWDKVQNWKAENGLLSWLEVVNSLAGRNSASRAKLIASFTTDPYTDLTNDLRSYNSEEYLFSWDDSGTTHRLTLDRYPQTLPELETRIAELQVDYDALVGEMKDNGKEIVTKRKEIKEEQKKIADQKKAIEDLLTAKKTEIIKELNDKYKITKGFKKTASEDNRHSAYDLNIIKQKIKTIRFLEHGDETKPSSLANETTILTEIEDIFAKRSKLNCDIFISEAGKPYDWQKAIDHFKKEWAEMGGLTTFHDDFVELEKLLKLTELEQEAKDKLAAALQKQTPTQTNHDWRNKLSQQIDPELGGEEVLTDEIITKWKEKKDDQDAFTNLTSFTSLWEKVSEQQKISPDFLTFVKGQDSKLVDLKTLLQTEPKKIITWISHWEYHKLDDPKKAEKHLRYAWSELGGKQKVDEYTLTAEDKKPGGNFEKFLYQCAIGKINYNSLEKPAEQQDNGDDSGKSGEETKPEGWKAWLVPGQGNYWRPALTYIGILLLILGVLAVIFRKNISEWWNDPTEEGKENLVEETEEEEKEETDDKEE